MRFICKFCHHEVDAVPYQGFNVIGWFAECPWCESENEVEPEDKEKEMDVFFEESEQDVLNEAFPERSRRGRKKKVVNGVSNSTL